MSHGGAELGKLLADGGSEDDMRDVEVAVGEPVAHPGDLHPRKGWLAGEQLRWEGFHRFVDLDEADSYSVEDQHVMKVAALEMGADGGDNVFEALTVPAAQSGPTSARTSAATPGLRSPAGNIADRR